MIGFNISFRKLSFTVSEENARANALAKASSSGGVSRAGLSHSTGVVEVSVEIVWRHLNSFASGISC